MTMLRATSSTRFLVLELGASREGDIAALVRLAMPDVAVVLKVGLAHAGEFGGVERTQRAKHELVRDLPADAVAILNHDDDRVAWMADRTPARVRWFGLDAVEDGLWAEEVTSSIDGTGATIRRGDESWPMTLRILGEQRVEAVEADGKTIPCDAVFILRKSVAPSVLLPQLEMDGAFVRVDRQMRTNLARVYAAGDCTGHPLQVAKAVGEGLVAAHTAATEWVTVSV
jgi:hypothetical protein